MSDTTDRLPPHDDLAEMAALGCALHDPADALSILCSRIRDREKLFYNARHSLIYSRLYYFHRENKPFDTILLASDLTEHGFPTSTEAVSYLNQLQDASVSAANLPYYLDILFEKYQLRTLIQTCASISNRAFDFSGEPGDLIMGAQSDLDLVRSPHSRNGHLTFRSPDEILAMQFNDSDILIGDRILAIGQPLVIAGQGSLGKSRLSMQMLACIVTGRKFLTLDTRKSDMRWMVVQSENNNQRLQRDLNNLRRWLGDDWPLFNNQVIIHTLETDSDGFLALHDVNVVNRLRESILKHAPGGILYDPLRDLSIGDMNKDVDMTATLHSISTLSRAGNPLRTPVILHHALTGKAGAAKATGYDRASFARNSKVLHGWTRAQINVAPLDAADNSRLVIACGKNNNGKEFPPFAVKLNPDTMIYECDDSVDMVAWQNEITESKPKRLITNEEILEFLPENRTRKTLVSALMAETGCGKTAAYDAIEKAEKSKIITFSKVSKQFCLPND